MFPYKCGTCGGGNVRCAARCSCEPGNACTCGHADHLPCNGGQFCWEDDVCFQVCEDPDNDPQLVEWLGTALHQGLYNGYGLITCEEIDDFQIVPLEFKDDFMNNGESSVFVHVWCKSCVQATA